MSLADAQEYIRTRISDYCVEIEDIFKKDRPRFVTVIVRPPDAPEQEVVVTSDPDPAAIVQTIQRRFQLDEAAQEIDRLTKNRDECAAVFEIDRKHELIGPIADCGCPSCNLHHQIKTLKAELEAEQQGHQTIMEAFVEDGTHLRRQVAQLEAERIAGQAQVRKLVSVLDALTAACEADVCGVETESYGNDESVGGGMHNDMALTFGMIRLARKVLDEATPQAAL